MILLRKYSNSKFLDTNSLEELAEKLSTGLFRKIAVMTGAGISVNAGIPDFRSDKGLYNTLQSLSLPFPEAIFDLNYFKNDPTAFYTVAKRFSSLHAKPTITHYFIKLLEEKGLLLMCYTQNVDGLEKKAGLSEKKLVQAHGNSDTAHCVDCGSEYDPWKLRKSIENGEIAYCECGGTVKPDIVFFGEKLPWEFHAKSELASYADLLLVMGTQLAVYPFSSLIDIVSPEAVRVVINKNNLKSYLNCNFLFNTEDGKKRDVFFEGCTDQILGKLCQLAGWSNELNKLIS